MIESVTALNKYGTTELHVAAGVGDTKQLERLLKEGGDPNVQNNIGFTPLHTAVINGELESVKILISHNSSPFVADSLGYSPLDKISIVLQRYEDNFNELVLSRYHKIHTHLQKRTFKPLTHICRDKILSCLVSPDSSAIRSLQIPQQLHSFLQYSVPEDIETDMSTLKKHPSPTLLRQQTAVSKQHASKCVIM